MQTFVVGALILGGCGLAWSFLQKQHRERQRAGQALLQATEAGELQEVQALLTRKAARNARNAYGLTPLHLAVAGGDVALVRLLLEHGADVHAQSNTGATPFYHATRGGGRQEIIALLRDYGAKEENAWDPAF